MKARVPWFWAKMPKPSPAAALSPFNRSVAQAPLKIGADYLKQLLPHAKVAISDHSLGKSPRLVERAGFEVVQYPYYRFQFTWPEL